MCIRFVFVGIVFFIGSKLTVEYKLNSQDVFLSIYVIFTAAMGAGFAMSSVPSATQAKESAATIFAMIDDKSQLDVRDYKGKLKEVPHGTIEFKNIDFKYPTRKNKVLDNFNMVIPAGKKIGLVGHSGCGKSTLTNLLLRFYEINQGDLLIDGQKIDQYDISELRKQIGYVMQEPVLFNTSIKENILFGNMSATDAQVRQYAEMANALQFIESNYEELTEQEQIEKMRESLREVCRKRQTEKNMKANVTESLEQLAKISDLVILKLVKETVENADAKFQQWLEENIEMFCSMIEMELLDQRSKAKSIRWDDLIIRSEWKKEIIDFLDNNYADSRHVFEAAAVDMPCQFDTKTISQLIFQDDQEITEELFENTVRSQERAFNERFKKRKLDRFKELYDAKLQDKIQLHEGFEKNCGLKGSKLSGGQKQRIAIARALIKEPKILILDEATSALDENSQEIVQQALDRAMEGRTSIVIAHRLSTIRNCELLFVIKEGKVVENGTYEELCAQSNSYFNKLKAGMEM